ncbi:3'-5' exonuclease [Puniceicoccales bacterium CK1056]|uniref:3'-5' exonuclease n=1 Tax=Oceanipulchritudo coccoides TaxID=2706888 RepID=A0A6B2M3A0_9BACT|nr:3'-5' exonuclease [Oceanipulchritudo coccoides]NDV62574.1 3'-5' exonuclease [Oceanipulchritudo coccoides]
MPEIEHYRQINQLKLSLEANWENFRFACIDSESTGLDPKRDAIISLAGVGLQNGEICLWDQFSVILPIAYNTSSVTVHGITREEASDGVEAPVALRAFLDWLGDGIIVGHHIQHDVTLINFALEKHFAIKLQNVVIDTMEAFLAVSEIGGFASLGEPRGYSLDALCDHFNIVPHDRHTALGDGFLTAQILLRILKEAAKYGQWNLHDLRAWHADEPIPEKEGK